MAGDRAPGRFAFRTVMRRVRTRPRTLLAGLAALAVVALALGWLVSDATSRAREVRREVALAEADLKRARDTVGALASLDAQSFPDATAMEAALGDIRSAHGHLAEAQARLGYLEHSFPLADMLPPTGGGPGSPLGAHPD